MEGLESQDCEIVGNWVMNCYCFLIEPLQVYQNIIRFHCQNPGSSRINGSNSFLVGTGKERILIDCGSCHEDESKTSKYITQLTSYLSSQNWTLKYILATHHHHDHMGAIRPLLESLSKTENLLEKSEVKFGK